ncbi:hypothetical protein PC9H_002198 [Pleurotus ostreatus]|uniref:Uncharacterized protein n=1 Tax=Pleurotus ostreatus TaxID=5322 RepID=A0A8H6ZKF6_PLEOS|nr:uncharacterized protein PC9H_002198 [Pleurotus ostreatus]KAF7419607.1 hypothetical protein PC9H_002198 [Pleurotus ostreatus]KAJ8689535.1 hypothetical protein PTI98_012433 [Pleurotus ostreatus]
MGYFDQASDFTIDGGTMNDVAGDYVTNNDTKNDNRSNCNNKSQSTVRNSHNDHSKKVVAGGKTTNNNNGGGSFYQANGEQNIYASPPVPQARPERSIRAMVANPPRRTMGAARLAARGGGVARPRQAIDQRPYNPTYSLPPSPPPQEAWPEYASPPPRFKSNNPFAKLAQGYAEQPRAAERPPFWEAKTTTNYGDDDDWFA